MPKYMTMAPTLVREPFRREGWVFEEKVDGWRMVAYKDDDHVQLVSRNGVDHTRRFADVAAAIAKLCARTLAIDGEVAIYDQQLRSRFDWLRDPDRNAVASPPLLSWRSTCSTTTAATSPGGRCVIGAPGWKTSWPSAGLVVPVRRLAADGLEAWKRVVER